VRTTCLGWLPPCGQYNRRQSSGKPLVASTSAATAALLLADAWFDVTTAPPDRPLLVALLLAVFVELPAAAIALRVHRDAGKKPPV
jgi:hypothetical protein